MRSTTIRLALAAVLAVAALAVGGCARTEPVEVAFTVEGMHCESCSAAITQALQQLEGVESATADHAAGTAAATCRSSEVDPERLAAEIEGLGYTVTSVTVTPAGG
jgi:copper chaperone CopZ